MMVFVGGQFFATILLFTKGNKRIRSPGWFLNTYSRAGCASALLSLVFPGKYLQIGARQTHKWFSVARWRLKF